MLGRPIPFALLRADADFESKHARDGGKFATQEGSGASGDDDSKTTPSHTEYLGGLDATAKDAIDSYTDWDYVEMNDCLRGGNCDDEPEWGEKNKALMQAIDNAPPFDEPVTLYRGVGGKFGEEVASNLAPGAVLEMAGFQSTTTDPDTARDFADLTTSGQVMFRITTSRGLAIGSDTGAGENEGEVILNHNWRYRVGSIDSSKTPPLVDLEVVDASK